MGFFGFNNKQRSSIGGDFDGDGVKNLKDCEPMNRFKQGPEHDERIGYQQDRVDFAYEQWKNGRKDESKENKNVWIKEKRNLTNLKSQRRSD